ncbi:MAG: SH3 domain-containing protein [Campylobacterales bacterium]|nr:SH3 domain-containing protein [Campylobacterales bacterium]
MLKFYTLLIVLTLGACSTHQYKFSESEKVIQDVELTLRDLQMIPQDTSFYSKGIDAGSYSLEDFLKKYFSIWNLEIFDINFKDAKWAYDAFKYGESYGENLQLIPEDFFKTVYENSNFSNYASINKRAVSLTLVNLRAFPTDKPLFRDPQKAGEGFPFDYLQNSTVSPNKPLLVSHYSKDKEWVFVSSSFAFGWVKSTEIAYVEENYTELWKAAKQVFILKDGIPIYDVNEKFLFKSRIGMLLPLINEDDATYTVLTVTKDYDSSTVYTHSKISKIDAHKGILSFQEQNLNLILNQLYSTNYGWGGLYGERDCSSTIRDFYIPFGLWLPRNSSKQIEEGEYYSLKGLSNDEKIVLIKKYAKPFKTLLYKPGHIVLYVGEGMNNEIVVFQNVWGVKTKENDTEGRRIVGKSVFSSLELGKELRNYDENGSLLSSLEGLNILKP